jgi:hypothetical protein
MKIVLRSLVVLVLLVVAALVAAVLGIDSIARTAVEKGGTYALGVDTKLAKADIGLFAGKTELGGLTVANPPGFETTPFLGLGHAQLAVTLSSLRSDVVEVPLFSLSDVAILLQKREGKTNYGVILDNLKRFESGQPPPEQKPQPKGEGKRFVIRKIEIKNVSADIDLLPIGGEATRAKVTIPSITLENVGTAEGGASVSEIVSKVVKALLQATLEAGGKVVGPELLADLKGKLNDLGLEAIHVGGDVQSEIEKVSPELGKKAGEVLKGVDKDLGGLLKKKKP